jgi:gamma-tubulin complex component 2
MWLDHKAPHWRDDCGDADMQKWKARIFSMRSRMLVFVRQILAFATGEVLESNWRILEAKIAQVQTVDQLLRDHVDFLDTCLKQCMLTTSKLLSVGSPSQAENDMMADEKVYAKLMKTISTFVSYQPKLTTYLDHFLADPNGETEAQRAKRWEILKTFEVNYNHHSQVRPLPPALAY